MRTLHTPKGIVPFHSHTGSPGKDEETEAEGWGPQSDSATAEDGNKLACKCVHTEDLESKGENAVRTRESFFRPTRAHLPKESSELRPEETGEVRSGGHFQ